MLITLGMQTESIFQAPEIPMQMIALGLVILAAHLGGKLCARLRLSEVTGQLLGGALVGPYSLHLLHLLPEGNLAYDNAINAFHFFVFVFLGLVAFGIGEELHITRVKKVGKAAFIICLIQGFLTWAAISGSFYFIAGKPLLDALLIGSIGIATAPAVTFVLMNQLNVEGRLRHLLGNMVVLDDLIEVIIFSLLIQFTISHSLPESAGGASAVLTVGREVLFALLVGGGIYLFLRTFVRKRAFSLAQDEGDHAHRRDEAFLQRILAEHPSPSVEILLIVLAAVSLGTGLAYHFHWPFLITAMFAGFLVANFHSQAIFDSLKLENIAPALNLAFFALIGANISMANLTLETLGLVGLYIVSRLVGKLAGTWIGCRVMREDKAITTYMPTLMLPQAGVAAVEAVYAAAILGRPEIAAIILPAIVFFEVVGVFMVDRGLRAWLERMRANEAAIRKERMHSRRSEAVHMLMAHLPIECIKLGLSGTTKKEVIEELVDHACRVSEEHIDRVQALQVLGEREQLASTALGNGIAVPHCRLRGIDNPVLFLGRHDKGVPFGGLDDEPCTLIFLMMTCARDPGQHLRLLAALSQILNSADVRKRFIEAHTSEEIIEIMTELASQA